MKTTVTLRDGMHFMGESGGYEIPIDAGEKGGGHNKGPMPKQLTLTSLAACTAMDVIGIANHSRWNIAARYSARDTLSTLRNTSDLDTSNRCRRRQNRRRPTEAAKLFRRGFINPQGKC